MKYNMFRCSRSLSRAVVSYLVYECQSRQLVVTRFNIMYLPVLVIVSEIWIFFFLSTGLAINYQLLFSWKVLYQFWYSALNDVGHI